MNLKLARTLTGLVLIAGSLVIHESRVEAQVSIGVSPSIIELSSKPGGTGDQVLQISSQVDSVTPVTIEVAPFPGLDEKYSAVEWIALDVTEIDLGPQSAEAVAFTVNIPSDAETGGAYAQILITTTTGDGTQIGGQLAVGVLFEIDGDGEFRRELTPNHFAPTLEPDGRIGFRAELANTGNTLAFLHGQMELDAAGDRDASASLQVQTTRLLPSITADVTSEGTLPLPAGSEWSSVTTIYPGDPAEIEDLKPIEIVSQFTVDPQLAVAGSICENLDTGPTVTLDLGNTGSIGLIPQVSFVLTRSDGSIVASIVPQNPNVAWPGEDTSTPIEGLPQLEGGDYLLTVSALIVQGLDPVVTEVPFSIGGFGDNVAPLCGSEPDATPDE